MADLNTNDLRRLLAEHESAKKDLIRVGMLVSALARQGDRATVAITMKVTPVESGREREAQEFGFRVIDADRYTAGHRVAPGREALAAQLLRFAQERQIDLASKLEGIEFQIRRVAREART